MSGIDVKKMMDGMREDLERDQAEGQLAGLTVDELADAVSHPKAAAVIAELMEAEAVSIQVGDPAPDFSLPRLPRAGQEPGPSLTLSEAFGRRPVALIFGSYT